MNLEQYLKAWETLEERIRYRSKTHGINEDAKHAITILMQEIAIRYGLPPRDWDEL